MGGSVSSALPAPGSFAETRSGLLPANTRGTNDRPPTHGTHTAGIGASPGLIVRPAGHAPGLRNESGRRRSKTATR